MAYRLKLQEPLAQGVRRIALEQIDMAEEKLTGNGDAAAAIHDARRCLKRLRALLRLVRPALDEKAYRLQAQRLAGTGRLLSDARDVHVMRQTLAKLESRFGPLPEGGGKRLTALIVASDASGSAEAGAAAPRQALQDLKHVRRFFTAKTLQEVSLEALAEGMERSYRKGRKAFRNAYRKQTEDAFHIWRKLVQQHWRHMQLLSRAWPEALSARASEARELSRLLGEDHDLAILLDFATQAVENGLTQQDVTALAAHCHACQEDIRNEAEAHGARLFAEPADDLKKRIAAYWTAAGHLATLAQAENGAPKSPSRRIRKRVQHAGR